MAGTLRGCNDLKIRRCKSDPNLYCHESGKLYVLAYVDDLLVVGTDEMRKQFMSRLSEEVLLKETGQLVPGPEHTFLGRRLRHNGDSIDVCMSQTYIDAILDLYGVKNAKPVATTGSVTIVKTVSDTPLSPEEHSVYRTAVRKTAMVGTDQRRHCLCNERTESGCDCPANSECCKA